MALVASSDQFDFAAHRICREPVRKLCKPVFLNHQQDFCDLRGIGKSLERVPKDRVLTQRGAELVETHPSGTACGYNDRGKHGESGQPGCKRLAQCSPIHAAPGKFRGPLHHQTHLRLPGCARLCNAPVQQRGNFLRRKRFGQERPEHLQLVNTGGIPAVVVVMEPTGMDTFVACRNGSVELSAVFRERHDFASGSTIHFQPDLQRAHLFDAETGKVLAA